MAKTKSKSKANKKKAKTTAEKTLDVLLAIESQLRFKNEMFYAALPEEAKGDWSYDISPDDDEDDEEDGLDTWIPNKVFAEWGK